MRAETDRYSPNFVKNSVLFDYGGGENLHLVCTNCGTIYPLQASAARRRGHLSKCVEIKAPYRWTMTRGAKFQDGFGERSFYKLRCNGQIILEVTDDSFPPDDLNRWQCSPFELVTEEYRFKYVFTNSFLSELRAFQNQIEGELDTLRGLKEDLNRATPYLDAATREFFALALTTCETGLRSASDGLSAVKADLKRSTPTIH